MDIAILTFILGFVAAAGAHLASKVAERCAEEAYKEIVGKEGVLTEEDDIWEGVRPLVGGWGCLVTVLEFVRGLGVLLALGSAVYLIAAK